MKRALFIILCLCFTLFIQAQVSKTLVNAAGNLKTALTPAELNTITNLTLTGYADARDFKTMRDDMPLLAVLNLSGVAISAYTGTEGTAGTSIFEYPVNSMPDFAFYNPDTSTGKTSLTSILLPATLSSIGIYALTSCDGLTSVTIPASVTLIGYGAFSDCSGLTSAVIPPLVTSLGDYAFSNCGSLTTVTIPASVTYIGERALGFCSNLSSIYAKGYIPVNLSAAPNVFDEVDKVTCSLHVPYGTSVRYSAANQWQDFTNIVEIPGFLLSANTANIAATAGSTASVTISSNVTWSASSDQTWLTVSPGSGTGTNTLTFTADANLSIGQRTATVTISATGVDPGSVTLTQAGYNATFAITAGGLSSALTPSELNTIAKLTLTGTMDARDFKTMRDNMPLLAELDISGTTVVSYSGTGGTSPFSPDYPANAIPAFAFSSLGPPQAGKTTLRSILLPSSVTTISYASFYLCSGLTTFTIPPSVTTIEGLAFGSCTSLPSVIIPASVSTIESGAFWSLITVNPANTHFSALGGVLFNLDQTTLIQCPASKAGSYTIPSSVTTIGPEAFIECSGLTSVTLPSSITSIQNNAFESCTGLASIYTGRAAPVDLSSSPDVFFNVDQINCILHVPAGSASAYDAASQWTDFTNIVEMPVFDLSPVNLSIAAAQGSTATATLTSNTAWTAGSGQTWLSVSPTSGTGGSTVTFTAEVNPSASTRTATVTFLAAGALTQTVTLTQQANTSLLSLSLTLYLEGPYDGSAGTMKITLRTQNLLPLVQPYTTAPWNYAGTETVTTMPSGVVDWILVELRQAASPAAATSATIFATRAAFLKSNGAIVDLDGTSPLRFDNVAISGGNNLYPVIRHRNHLAVMAGNSVTQDGNGIYLYDFSTGPDKVYGGSNGYKQIGSSPLRYGMVAGDGDPNGQIFISDYNNWASQFGNTNVYHSSDLDMDGDTFITDYNKWATNFGTSSNGNLKSTRVNKSYFSCVPQ